MVRVLNTGQIIV